MLGLASSPLAAPLPLWALKEYYYYIRFRSFTYNGRTALKRGAIRGAGQGDRCVLARDPPLQGFGDRHPTCAQARGGPPVVAEALSSPVGGNHTAPRVLIVDAFHRIPILVPAATVAGIRV